MKQVVGVKAELDHDAERQAWALLPPCSLTQDRFSYPWGSIRLSAACPKVLTSAITSWAARKLLIRSYILLRDQIDYAEFGRRAVAARLARLASKA